MARTPITEFDHIGIADWLVETGNIDEDGCPEIKTVYLIRAERPDGSRFELSRRFEDEFKAESTVEWIRRHGSVDLDAHWSTIEPAYGTDAYLRYQNSGEALADERRRDEDFEFNERTGGTPLTNYNRGF